jgi:hypothetical protein
MNLLLQIHQPPKTLFQVQIPQISFMQMQLFHVLIAQGKNNPNDKRSGKTAILTSPYKKELEESVSKRSIKKPKLNFNDKEKSVQSEKLDSIDKQIATKNCYKNQNSKKDI